MFQLQSSLLVIAGKSITECSARDMCENWSPCYAKPPLWLTAELDIILCVS